MTLAPAIHPSIRGVEGKRRAVERLCCAPGCISISQQGHHLWPRSYLRGQPLEWVSLPSGRIISNVVGLCMRHHAWITGGIGGHLAVVRLESDETFVWFESDGADGWVNCGLLHPQPWSETPVENPVDSVDSVDPVDLHDHPDLAEGETCESCGYTRPRKRAAGPKRPTKTWALVVPDDAEIGSEVLDEWVEQFAVVLGFGSDVTQRLVRYHTIVAVLAWAMQHRTEFIADVKEASEAA